MNDYYEVTRIGERTDGSQYKDTIVLDPEQSNLLLDTLRVAIRDIEDKVAWRVREQYAKRHTALVNLLVTLDI